MRQYVARPGQECKSELIVMMRSKFSSNWWFSEYCQDLLSWIFHTISNISYQNIVQLSNSDLQADEVFIRTFATCLKI